MDLGHEPEKLDKYSLSYHQICKFSLFTQGDAAILKTKEHTIIRYINSSMWANKSNVLFDF